MMEEVDLTGVCVCDIDEIIFKKKQKKIIKFIAFIFFDIKKYILNIRKVKNI